MQGFNLSTACNCNSSTSQPDFKILKKTSICQRQRYQWMTSIACSTVCIGTLVNNIHSIGSTPCGVLISRANTTLILIAGSLIPTRVGGFNDTVTALISCVTFLAFLFFV